MSSERRYPRAPTAVLLVLLLYLLSAFTSASITALGLSQFWAEVGMRGLLAGTGLALYLAYQGPGIRDGDPKMEIPRGAISGAVLAVLLIAYEVLALVARATDASYSQLPPIEAMAVQLLLGAAGEEILFVGFLYGIFRRQLSWPAAVLCAGFLFVLLHWPTNAIAVMTRALYIFCSFALFEAARSISLNVSLHLAVNGVAFVCVLLFTGTTPPESIRALAGPASVGVGSATFLFALWIGFWPLLSSKVGVSTSDVKAPTAG
jgi:membrane protease YdiL (CAAX protease family)